jgi:predicted 3-demethylubiquinone-9 3-methyltransferase (glyoxalase superfamily)
VARKITPFLWFDNNLEEAMDFYVSIFPDAEIQDVNRAGDDGPVFTASFRLAGQEFMGLNGGPHFRFTEAVSFFITCESQEEVDRYWDTLTADGGEPSQCGWLKDRFGLSWQVIPTRLMELLGDPDRERADRAMQAMLTMQKIDIAALESAADAVPA